MIRSTGQGNSEVKNKYLEVKSEVYNLMGIVSKGTLTLFTKMPENVTDYFTMIGTQKLVLFAHAFSRLLNKFQRN